jgi:hypothetical protein
MRRPTACSSQVARSSKKLVWYLIAVTATCALQFFAGDRASAEESPSAVPAVPQSNVAAPGSVARSPATQADREAAFAKLLSNATLDGNFTMTDAGTVSGNNATKLNHDKYTLGEVKKLAGNQWQITTRIEYGDHDFTVPLTLPVEWAGDTPVIVVDNVGLPGLGTVSARVMFFADHYAGFWQHGTRTGHLFGVIRHEAAKP